MAEQATLPQAQTAKAAARPKRKFRLIAGRHIQNNAQGQERRWLQGEVFESDRNFALRDSNKFERVPDDTPASPGHPTGRAIQEAREAEEPMPDMPGSLPNDPPKSKPLEAMTAAELRAFAEANEIDLGNRKSTKDLLEAIKGAI